MSMQASRFFLAVFVLVLAVAPGTTQAGEFRKKSNAAHAQHRAQMQQQAAVQQHHQVAARSTATGVAHHNGVNTAHHAQSGMNQNRQGATGPMVSSLHSVVARLNQAQHDYEGHRVQAIHQLGQAIHTLQSGTNHGGLNGTNHLAGTGTNGRGTGHGTNAAPRISQAESDAHLRQAHQELVALESHMSGGANGTTKAGHHPQAHTHVQQALQHLNTALAIR